MCNGQLDKMTKAEAEVERVEVRIGREGAPPAGAGRGMPLTRHARRASALQDVEDDIDEEFIESVLLHSINSGNEARPDWTGGGEGGSGGYGRAP